MALVGDPASASIASSIVIPDDPAARLQMRRAFYSRFGYAHDGGFGYGASELKFLEWEVNRGVLNPLDAPHPGSRWWRDVNAGLLRDAEHAALLFEAGHQGPVGGAAGRWLAYLRHPSGRTWYRAHNASIVSGYLACTHLATAETESEQEFMNIVLYRLLYAQAMVEGAAPGLMRLLSEVVPFGFVVRLERWLADPRWFSVDIIVKLPEFYPDNYPATASEMAVERGRSRWGNLLPSAWFDDDLICRRLRSLYHEAAGWLETPMLMRCLNHRNQPTYPKVEHSAPAGPH